jgi:RNA polymerase sigma-70 factor (ECF subfamily)
VSTAASQIFSGHDNNFEDVVSYYSPVLFRVALRRLRNVQDAEDAVQDAFLSAHKYIGQFQGRSKLSTWLTTIVSNAALQKLRRHSRYEMLPLERDGENSSLAWANRLIDAGPNPETIYARKEIDEKLHCALEQLSPKLRIAIQLYDLEGVSMREAAHTLGVSKGAMKSRVKRARESLNESMGRVVTRRRPAECVFRVKGKPREAISI